MYDDLNRCTIPGIEQFRDIVDVDNPVPLTFVDQYSLTELTAELSTAAYAGMLMQQPLGLGGWMFDGIDRLTVLGASTDPDVPGLGFRYDTDPRWPFPNPTGLAGVFEGYCPPHHPTMRAAVEQFCRRKFGPDGPFHPDTPGPWKDSRTVRSSAKVHDDRFIECVAIQAQYAYDTFGRFPATVPTIHILMYLQSHHLDLEYYDLLFKPGSYLETHRDHLKHWHNVELE
jgi:hypothetical protein